VQLRHQAHAQLLCPWGRGSKCSRIVMFWWCFLTSYICIFYFEESFLMLLYQINFQNIFSRCWLAFLRLYNFVSYCRLLNPYIRRDMETTPLWLCLMGEVQAKANRNIPHWHPPRRHPIDYSYVRPQHISSINSLCREFFYPGIDCKCICLHYCILWIRMFDVQN
jgi:hypothetical protein